MDLWYSSGKQYIQKTLTMDPLGTFNKSYLKLDPENVNWNFWKMLLISKSLDSQNGKVHS